MPEELDSQTRMQRAQTLEILLRLAELRIENRNDYTQEEYIKLLLADFESDVVTFNRVRSLVRRYTKHMWHRFDRVAWDDFKQTKYQQFVSLCTNPKYHKFHATDVHAYRVAYHMDDGSAVRFALLPEEEHAVWLSTLELGAYDPRLNLLASQGNEGRKKWLSTRFPLRSVYVVRFLPGKLAKTNEEAVGFAFRRGILYTESQWARFESAREGFTVSDSPLLAQLEATPTLQRESAEHKTEEQVQEVCRQAEEALSVCMEKLKALRTS